MDMQTYWVSDIIRLAVLPHVYANFGNFLSQPPSVRNIFEITAMLN